MKHQQKPVVLYFHPSQPCSICGRASNVGTMDNFTAGLVVHCWEHGLVQFFAEGEKPTQYALQELYASVARFVIAMMNGFGTATVIGPIAVQDVPGWEPPTLSKMEKYQYGFEGNESAWIVRYEHEDTLKMVFACWSYDENMFYLYDEEHGLVGPLESEQ